MSKRIYMVAILLLVSAIIGCNGGKMEETKVHYNSFKDVPISAWEKLAEKKIYFGHQSVGSNIIDGIKDLMKENPEIKLNIVKTSDPNELIKGLFAHSGLGKNFEPESKIDGFINLINGGMGKKADIAFFKFCYVDIIDKTDVENIYNQYNTAMNELKRKYPKTTFVHVTAPLRTEQTGFARFIAIIKNIIKKIIGKPVLDSIGNMKRNQYNDMIRNNYNGKEPIFDLAKIESTLPDGTRAIFKKNGNSYYFLTPVYSDDGGHLNETGRQKAAKQLLLLLVSL